jgi:phytoene desaturase
MNAHTSAPTAAVIGAGFGGIALAIRLQSAGFAVTLYEARDKPGGRAYVYEDKGYVFDGGPTVITDPACLEALFALSGRRMADYVELMPVTPFYRLQWSDGVSFDYVDDQAELDRQMQALEPRDVAGYRKFLAYSEDLYREGYEKLGTVPFLDWGSMLRAAPDLVRLEAWKTVHDKVAEFIKEPHLRQAFSFHSLLVGGNPFATSSIYALIHALERKGGVWFPKGGTGALIRGLLQLFTDLGGETRIGAPIEAITTEAGAVTGVKVAGEAPRRFGVVASNADVHTTYDRLLKAEPLAAPVARSLARKRWSMSLFVIYFGARKQWPDVAHHTVLFGPRYKELIKDIFNGPELAEDFSLYLHRPTASDPTLAPQGSDGFYVLSPVPHLGNADIDWDVQGPLYRDRILRYLDETTLPGLMDSLETTRILTPKGFQDELGAHLGSAFSLEPILTQSAFFRAHNRDDKIKGLYLVGAGTHPGAGVPGVVGSATATAGLMIADAGLSAAGAAAPLPLAAPLAAE